MIENYLKDYYLLKIDLADLCKKVGIHSSTFYRYLKDNELLPRREYYGLINTGDKELDEKLKIDYSSIVKRCNGAPSYQHKKYYQGKEYMPIYEWVEFCNSNKEKLMSMWSEFKKMDRDRRYSISFDRIDNEKGYTKDNLQIVTHGFNAWKRNVNPIAVTYKNETKYFMSGEEASRYYGIRRQTIGDILRGQKRILAKEYFPKRSTVDKVLLENGVFNLEQYYNEVFGER